MFQLSCNNIEVLICFKIIIVVLIFSEYLLGKTKAGSTLGLTLKSTRAVLVFTLLLIIAAMIRIKQWRDKK